ncbi:MAG TPA: MBL fold metallo-hydrolase [Luteolibacter sp.]|nr:MBL fold metallo-hydrolase [Luteolibacter sp.]
MIRFAVLGSGSGGNSAVVECGDVRLLIDAGLSAKQIQLRLAMLGIEPSMLDGILLTHEHGDHVRGLEVFRRKCPVPVYATAETRQELALQGHACGDWKTFETAQSFQIGAAVIESFTVHHDAVDPVGYVISHQSRQLGVVSDVGHITRSMTERLRGMHGLFVEANYDCELLENDTKRPWSIKQRISSRHGHLSNDQVVELIREIAHPQMARVVLGHLSSDCNKPDLALARLRACLHELGHPDVDLHCACQHEPTGWFEL